MTKVKKKSFEDRLDRAERLIAEAAEERRREAEERRQAAAAHEKRMVEEEEARKKRAAEFDREMEKMRQHIGGFTQTAGEALEDEFFAALDESRRVGDISLTDVKQRINGFLYEYDLVGKNGKFILVGEIKHKLGGQEVRHFAENRLPYFAQDFPGVAKRRKILGMVGGSRITAKAREEAEKRGLIILRLRNKKLVVENESAAQV